MRFTILTRIRNKLTEREKKTSIIQKITAPQASASPQSLRERNEPRLDGREHARLTRLTSARGVVSYGHLGERGVEHDVGAVLEQRDGDAAHAGARGYGGLDGAAAGGARHARDPHVRLRALLPVVLRRRRRRLRPSHLLVVRVQQRHVLHIVGAPARSRRPAAGGDRRELQVGHVRRSDRGGAERGGNIWWETNEQEGWWWG